MRSARREKSRDRRRREAVAPFPGGGFAQTFANWRRNRGKQRPHKQDIAAMNKPTANPSFARPAFAEEARKALDALVKAHPEIEFVDAVLSDICGVLRGKRIPIGATGYLF